MDSKTNQLLEPAGGAISPVSPFYIVRDADGQMFNSIEARESIVLLRGPHQVGKTSLLGQGIKHVKSLGWKYVSTDFQMISSVQLNDHDLFARVLTATLARQLGISYDLEREWEDVFGPNMNMANFMRTAIAGLDTPMVWFMDEADRMFDAAFGSDFFGLVRSWHNARATDPDGPWGRLTIVISYATEARLFIRDLNQSPFNVGRRVPLSNFTLDQVSELNERYGFPVKRRSDLQALYFLLAGQPYMMRVAFDHLATGAIDFSALLETADRDDGPFGDHLRRLLAAVTQFPDVRTALRTSLDLATSAKPESIERLVAAGVLRQEPNGEVVPACDLYAQYLQAHTA